MEPRRIILLGASNLTLAWPRLLDVIASVCQEPMEVRTEHGMGRSYFLPYSRFVFRELPGILQSGLWSSLAQTPDREPLALITDIGNDLVYGRQPTEIGDAIDECVTRIRSWHPESRIVLTRPPVTSVQDVGRLRFAFFRRVLFPATSLTLETIKTGTAELDDRLVALANERSVCLVEPERQWYGLDPIHVRLRWQRAAFRKILQHWGMGITDCNDVAKRVRVSGRRPVPETVLRLGREQIHSQPSIQTKDFSVFCY